MTSNVLNVEWHPDGHKVKLLINRDRVEATPLPCPKDPGPGADCFNDRVGCVVAWFINLYGLECNVGQAPATPEMEVAWALIGDRYDLDACQLWVIPTSDDIFAAWTASL